MNESLEVVEVKLDELYYTMPKEIIDKYDFQKTKENVDDLIGQYKTAKFEYLVSEAILSKITTCYQPKYNQMGNIYNDKLGDNVGIQIDSSNIIEQFDNIFNPLFDMLTDKERKYYNLGLINNNSEQFVAESIGISRTGLQPIKQNCILKIALVFHIAVLKI